VAKDLSQRYPDAESMVSELEEVLAIEAARAGQATGEATSVLRTLPGSARGRLPWRMRHPRRLAAALALLAAVVATALVIALIHTHRGTGVASNVRTESGLVPVPLGQTAARDYNPFGTGPENHDRVQNVIDSEPGTAWSTESYYDGTLRKPGGAGTGVYLDAAPGVRGRGIEIQTTTPGFAVQLYTSNSVNLSYPYGNATTLAGRGWRGPIGASGYVHRRERIRFAGVNQRYRYYLLWLTSLPPGGMSASISELTLFK
jgi:eukaryotic-like serine/threonine-protein kinase